MKKACLLSLLLAHSLLISSTSAAESVNNLLAALNNSDPGVRARAAEELAETKEQRAVRPLLLLLNDEPAVRMPAAKALAAIGDRRAIEPLFDWTVDPRRLVDDHVAFDALEKFGDAAVEPALRRLGDADPAVCAAGAKVLGRIGDSRAVGPLVTALKKNDVRTAGFVTTALQKIGATAVEPLVTCLTHEQLNVRHQAILALQEIGDERAVKPLLQHLARYQDPPDVQTMNALKSFGVASIEPYRHDADPRVSKAAEMVLAQVPRIPPDALWAQPDDATAQAIAAIKDAKSIAVPMEFLKHDDPMVRRAAVRALGELRDPQALKPLIELLKDPDAAVRAAAAIAAGSSGDARVVARLSDCTRDEDAAVRTAAVQGLTYVGKPAVPALVKLLKSSDLEILDYVIPALGTIEDPRGIEAMVPLLIHENQRIRTAAAVVLIGFGDETLVPAMKRALNAPRQENMANLYLNSRNPQLMSAARQWAARNGYEEKTSGGALKVEWGTMRGKKNR